MLDKLSKTLTANMTGIGIALLLVSILLNTLFVEETAFLSRNTRRALFAVGFILILVGWRRKRREEV